MLDEICVGAVGSRSCGSSARGAPLDGEVDCRSSARGAPLSAAGSVADAQRAASACDCARGVGALYSARGVSTSASRPARLLALSVHGDLTLNAACAAPPPLGASHLAAFWCGYDTLTANLRRAAAARPPRGEARALAPPVAPPVVAARIATPPPPVGVADVAASPDERAAVAVERERDDESSASTALFSEAAPPDPLAARRAQLLDIATRHFTARLLASSRKRKLCDADAGAQCDTVPAGGTRSLAPAYRTPRGRCDFDARALVGGSCQAGVEAAAEACAVPVRLS
ncbi:hypothetical protein KFE25_014211 [Diacronema lutheri]|uniref:Uncharacterized protein n=2 Tax=Diacronema lutheri TaxID=2081491 RepID=A0A8J5X7E7_DIALT|nr:hypothetical protein KFE25_014211 [Diacronema lutheri]